MSVEFSVRHNIQAMFAHRQSNLNNGTVNKALERLSSGYRINRASDDAAGLAVSEKLRAEIRGFHQAARNVQDGISFVQTGDAATQNIHDLLQRMRELAIQSANGVYTDTDRANIQLEIDQLMEEIDRIHTSTYFGDKRVFDYRAADIVWLVDGTGSMGLLQTDLENEAPNFINELNARQISFRVAAARFGGPSGPVAMVGGMTTDAATFRAEVDAVNTTVGPEENGMQALNSALGLYSYRAVARKIFIVLTDEDSDDGVQPPANDQGPFPDITSSTAANMKTNNVVVFAVAGNTGFAAPHSAQSEEAYFDTAGSKGVPAATGGKRFTAITAGMSAQLAEGVKNVIGTGVQIHSGAYENQTIISALQSPVSTVTLGIKDKIKTTSQAVSQSSIVYIDSAINQISRLRANIGADMNRLEFSLNYVRIAEESLQSAESRIRDADMAAEIIEFTKAQVINQSSNAMLAQANLGPQNVLSLLG